MERGLETMRTSEREVIMHIRFVRISALNKDEFGIRY